MVKKYLAQSPIGYKKRHEDTAHEVILAYFFRGEPVQNRRAQSRKFAEKSDKSLNFFFTGMKGIKGRMLFLNQRQGFGFKPYPLDPLPPG